MTVGSTNNVSSFHGDETLNSLVVSLSNSDVMAGSSKNVSSIRRDETLDL